jgi:hypothetical protein
VCLSRAHPAANISSGSTGRRVINIVCFIDNFEAYIAAELRVCYFRFNFRYRESLRLPVKFSATPDKVRTGAPLYGEHSRGVLREYGFDDQQIRTFEKDRAIVASDRNCL